MRHMYIQIFGKSPLRRIDRIYMCVYNVRGWGYRNLDSAQLRTDANGSSEGHAASGPSRPGMESAMKLS